MIFKYNEEIEINETLCLLKISDKYGVTKPSLEMLKNTKEAFKLRRLRNITDEEIRKLKEIAVDEDLYLINVLLKNVKKIENVESFYYICVKYELEDIINFIQEFKPTFIDII